ncbi:60S ribosomal protein L13 [Nowakowskiella sp. JEL0078]|nr:60S ribosomal protein L13 [Nowakowskiella sp. JEL0078]
MKGNNVLPNVHLRKDWQLRVKTWFDQPGAKKRRRLNRIKKAALIAPRPIDGLLRPVVRGPTLKYNTKLRAGRGFTLEELKAAGIRRKEARSIGISVDHRRRNRSVESLESNKARLQEYQSRLIVFPKKAGKPKAGDSIDASALASTKQLKGPILPITQPTPTLVHVKSIGDNKTDAFLRLRRARADKHFKGVREAKAKVKEEEEKAKQGK